VNAPLLSTKFHIHRPRPNDIRRPALVDRLHKGIRRKLTLISAPAGFGKSTLVGEWVDRLQTQPATGGHGENRIAWLSLEQNDDKYVRFLAYFLGALQIVEFQNRTNKRIGAVSATMLSMPTPPSPEQIFTPLLNEITGLSDRIVMVLDDFHVIENHAICDALSFLLTHMPGNLHLVIATRQDPSLALAGFRARDEMTEGWAAGLQLAAMSLEGRDDIDKAIASFAGSHRHVSDYLLEEVLSRLPGELQKFLVETSILDRMTGALCDAVCGGENGQHVLESLEQTNSFIVPLDSERRWYRYHHLFAELLRIRLHENLNSSTGESPEGADDLHLRASQWYESNGYFDTAIHHAFQARDDKRAACLIEDQADSLWEHGAHGTLKRWLALLPADVLRTIPYLGVFQAWYQCHAGQHDASEKSLCAAERAIESKNQSITDMHENVPGQDMVKMVILGRAETTRACTASYQSNTEGIIRHARRALDSLPDSDRSWRGMSALVLGDAHFHNGNMIESYESQLEAVRTCKAAGFVFNVMAAQLKLAITLRQMGRLQETVEICREQKRIAVVNHLEESSAVGWMLTIWGETLAELDDLPEALEKATKGVAIIEHAGGMAERGWGYLHLIRILFSLGDFDRGKEIIRRMDSTARESAVVPDVERMIAGWQIRIWLLQGKLETASRAITVSRNIRDGDRSSTGDIDFYALHDAIVRVRVSIALGRYDDALLDLPNLLEGAERSGHVSKVVEILILQAIALTDAGATVEGLNAFERALRPRA
jgi:LuxR family transcriptional regulator, maltose regulon positive regulatory protein